MEKRKVKVSEDSRMRVEVGVRGVGGAETEAATADFRWVLYIPRVEVGLSAPPSDKGAEGKGRGGLCGRRRSPVQQLPSLTCTPAPCGDTQTNRCCPLLRNSPAAH